MIEGIANDALRARAGDERYGLRGRARIASDSDVVLIPDVAPLRILPNEHEVDSLVATAGRDRRGGPHVRIQIERLAQRHVDGAETFSHRRLERTLQRDAGASDRVEGFVRNGIAIARNTGHAGILCIPLYVRTGRLENAHGRATDGRTDAVARNECDQCCHVRAIPAQGAVTRSAKRVARLAMTAGVMALAGCLAATPTPQHPPAPPSPPPPPGPARPFARPPHPNTQL